MFSNLSKGSILHGVDRRDGNMKWFTGSVERVTPSLNNQYQNPFGQVPVMNVDIIAIVDGVQKEYKSIHANDTIADFGKDSIILSDNKDYLYNYVKSLLKTSEDVVDENNIQYHKRLIPQYKSVLRDMRPDVSNASEVKELKEQVGNLQAQLAEALSLLKSGASSGKSEGTVAP
jgi:uncharacterized phage infection (PIP) family protein YhgE